MSVKSFVICTGAEAPLSILAWAVSIGVSVNLRAVLVFIWVLFDCNKQSGFNLSWWGLQSLSPTKDSSLLIGWSKGCPVSRYGSGVSRCGSGAISKSLGTGLLFGRILNQFLPVGKIKDGHFDPGKQSQWWACVATIHSASISRWLQMLSY